MQHLVFAVYLLATAYAFARLEIEIEGPNGWAGNLPTWRIRNRWTNLLYGGRPLTGYHLWIQVFILMMVHSPFAMSIWNWSLALELRVLSFLVLFFIVEDFLWFLINPAFGIRRFRREHIWWHAPTWWWVMPREYWVFSLVGLAAYVAAMKLG